MAATIKIALVSRTIFYAPVWVAEQNGYFRDEGIDARFEIFDNAEKINEVMHAGVAQIAIASVEALVADAFKGGKFRIVASVAQKPPHFIIAQPKFKTVTGPPRRALWRAVAARGHDLFRAGPRKSDRLQPRRHHHRRGRRRADALEAAARGQDRRRPAAVSAELRVGSRGLQQPRPDLEIRAGLRVHRGVPRSGLGPGQQAGRHGLPARAAARPGRHGRRSGQGRRRPGQGAWHHARLRPPRHRRRAQIQADARRPCRLRGRHAARLRQRCSAPGSCPTTQPFDMGRFVDPSYLAAAR